MKKITALMLTICMTVLLLTACKENGKEPSVPNFNAEIPKSDYNPLTGLKKGSDYPEGQRPVAIMVNNLYESLPQSGTGSADLIYEMVTEGGITRLMAVYTDYKTVPMTGSVRSARDQFVQLVMPLHALYVHIGTSSYAKDMLNYYSYQDIDGIYLGSTAFYFDAGRRNQTSSEHCWYTNGPLIAAGLSKIALSDQGATAPVFSFIKPDAAKVSPKDGEAKNISFRFSGYADAAFAYDEQSKLYRKSEFNLPQMDSLTNTQLAFDNLFILGTTVTFKPDGLCTDFNFSSGDGYYFTGGKFEKIKWEKGKPEDALNFTVNGKPLSVNCGKSYVAFIDHTHFTAISITGAAVAPPNEAAPTA